ncbi:hypothetical protein [Kibdelosporangium persicum]|nr:hypothetical protein [Kibdelosporangium persicum]
MTHDELRARLRDASADLAPRDDLLKSLAEGHVRRHKRVRRGLIGGSVAATVLVAALLGTMLTGSPPPEQVDPARPTPAQILAKARAADEAAQNMIMCFGSGGGPQWRSNGFALRSENLGRVTQLGSDLIARPDGLRQVDHSRRTVLFTRMPGADAIRHLFVPGTGDARWWLREDAKVQSVSIGKSIHLTMSAPTGFTEYQVYLDLETFLIRQVVADGVLLNYWWLPATNENRERVAQSIPPDYRETVVGE